MMHDEARQTASVIQGDQLQMAGMMGQLGNEGFQQQERLNQNAYQNHLSGMQNAQAMQMMQAENVALTQNLQGQLNADQNQDNAEVANIGKRTAEHGAKIEQLAKQLPQIGQMAQGIHSDLQGLAQQIQSNDGTLGSIMGGIQQTLQTVNQLGVQVSRMKERGGW